MSNAKDFKINKDGVLTKYVGPGGDVVIPEGVTEIGKGVFNWMKIPGVQLGTVTLPDSVTAIQDEAFFVSAVTAVKINHGVRTIGKYAIARCDKITELHIPDSVTEIGKNAFEHNKKLKTVKLSAALTEIPRDAFSGCVALKTIEIPEGVTSIGSNAFFGCKNLIEVTIPASVEKIGSGAFDGCPKLKVHIKSHLKITKGMFPETTKFV